MSADRIKSASRNILWGSANKIITIFLPFINRTVLIRVLGADYLGLDSLFLSILQMLNIAELGFSSTVIYCLYEPIVKADVKKVCAILNLYRTAYRIIGILILGLGIAVMPFLSKLIKNDLPDNVNLYLLYLIFLLNTILGYWLFAYKKSVISAFQREDILSNINTGITICKTLVQVSILYVFRQYYLYVLIMPVLTVAENFIVAVIAKKMFPEYIPQGTVDNEVRKNIKKRISGLFIQNVCSISRNSLDNIVLSTFAGLSMVTRYGNYYYVMSAISKFLSNITKSIYSIVGNKMIASSIDENHSDMLKFNFIYMWLATICVTCLLSLYQPFMIIWMGKEMLLPIKTVVLICVYFYLLCLGDVRSIYHSGAGLWWESRYRSILEATSNLVLNIILGYFWGVTGIIIATIFSIFFINFIYGSSITYKYYFKNNLLPIYYIHQLYGCCVAFIAAGLSYLICEEFLGETYFDLFFRLCIGIVVPNIVLFICNCKRKIFKETYIFIKKGIYSMK